MCYYVTQKTNPKKIAQHYHAVLDAQVEEMFEPLYFANGFAHPKLSVLVSGAEGRCVASMQWGLMNNWKRPYSEMLKLSNGTLNAKSETVFDLVSFRSSILTHRCVIPVENFFEYKHVGQDKLPYVIQPKTSTFFNLAGIFAQYQDPEKGLWHNSFSICTAPANQFMRSIHNTKFRQPVILRDVEIGPWLDSATSKPELIHLMAGVDDAEFASYRARRDLLKLGNVEAVLEVSNI